MNGLSWLQARGERLIAIARMPLDTPRRLYFTGFALAILGLAQEGGLTNIFWAVVWVAGLGVICVGFIKEIWAKIKALLTSSTAHKVVAALGGAVIMLPSYIWAHQSVNLITGLAPESFSLSVSALAVGYAVPVALMTGALILSVYSIWPALALMWHFIRAQLGMLTMFLLIAPPKIDQEQGLLHVSRMMAAMTLATMFSYFVDPHNQVKETLKQIRIAVVIGTDYYARSPCRNVTAHERVAFLKDGKISVATRQAGQWHFRLDSC